MITITLKGIILLYFLFLFDFNWKYLAEMPLKYLTINLELCNNNHAAISAVSLSFLDIDLRLFEKAYHGGAPTPMM